MSEATVTELAVRMLNTLKNISPKARQAREQILIDWFIYCSSQRYPRSQWYCNLPRLQEYGERVVDIRELRRRLNVLFLTWQTPEPGADNDLKKKMYEAAYGRIREHLWGRIEKEFKSRHGDDSGRYDRVSSSAAPPPKAQTMMSGDARRQGVEQARRKPREIDLGCNQIVDEHITSPDGITADFDSGPMGVSWRTYAQETNTYLNCLLLRRSSFGSIQMRAWHNLSLCMWTDANALRKTLVLGSLSLQQKRLSASSVSQTKQMLGSGNPRTRRPLTDSGSELLRNRSILQCPWNALAILFYHKYHVRKEPPPDFSSDSWMDEPVFSQDKSGFDDSLRKHCASEYNEFKRVIQTGKQSFKRMTTKTFHEVNHQLNQSRLFRSTVTSLQNLVMSKRYLQNGLMEKILEAFVIPRQQLVVPDELTEQIFPFADGVADFPGWEAPGDVADKERHLAALNFCNLLKALRTALLQDMALLSYNPFYHRMVRGISIMLTPPFQDYRFVTLTQDTLEHSWGKDFQALIKETPRAHELGFVVPDNAYSAPSVDVGQPQPGSDSTSGHSSVNKRQRSSTVVPDDAAQSTQPAECQGVGDIAKVFAETGVSQRGYADTPASSNGSSTATESDSSSFESVTQQLTWLIENIRASPVASNKSVLRKLIRLHQVHTEREQQILHMIQARSVLLTTGDDIQSKLKKNMDEMSATMERVCSIMRSMNESDGWVSTTMQQITAKLREAFQSTMEINGC
ncbi:hypothetical protein DL89DRAFT_266697 [Linderina pennispora]|uniref:Ndc10 domain-containing protein n=1 Tax=Linderina pennispora TaxID=61395 RepID=A0A1Y1WAC4_9FUNG|nr:uncharacterized protein DL89DRAFT_266697 [Linderina pennispora]ORX70489.1 hypothetical protein DL89DRAFT_266697 [Linderina pennispora]